MSRCTRGFHLSVVLGVVLLTGSALTAAEQNSAVLIPLPAKVTPGEGGFVLQRATAIQVTESESDTARILADDILRATGFKMAVQAEASPTPRDGAIVLALDPARANLGDEGYALEVTPKGVSITAAKSAGLFYGMQTLRQLLPLKPVEGQTEYTLPGMRIEDQPRFGWRGFMLDSSRHFVTKETILKLLDALAMAKINRFHWHLVDDQAWRLAISKYPRLVQPIPTKDETYSQAMGFYSPSDVREIADRAQRLHIMIMPEIEMPSHATQAASVLPEASCLGADGKPLAPGTTREICLGSDKAIAALQDVVAETIALFPNSPYIHLGGDEAEDKHWKVCSRCKARMAELGITDPRLMQKWFMDKMNRFVREHGRTSVAWADRLSLGIPEAQIVHGWHAGELEEAVAKGFPSIQSQHDYTYFDYSQGPGDTAFGGASLTVERVYSLDPVRGLTPEQAKLVLGPQAQLWTELVADNRVFVKVFPRILALAEVGWTPQAKRDEKEFTHRLTAFLPRLDALGIPYFQVGRSAGTWKPENNVRDFQGHGLERYFADQESGAGGAWNWPTSAASMAFRIQSVALLEDGREIARDSPRRVHPAPRHQNNVYHITIPAVKAGATYTLRTHLRSEGGTDSFGTVLVR